MCNTSKPIHIYVLLLSTYRNAPHTDRENNTILVFLLTGHPTRLYDIVISPDVAVIQGCGLGGTSLINANVALDCDPRVFEDEVSESM